MNDIDLWAHFTDIIGLPYDLTPQVYVNTIHDAITQTFHGFSAWLRVLVLILAPLMKIFVLYIWPLLSILIEYMLLGVHYVYVWHTTFSWTTLIIECGVVVTLFVIYFVQKWITKKKYVPRARKWLNTTKKRVLQPFIKVQDEVRMKSRILAAFLPHIIYVIICGIFMYMFRDISVNIMGCNGPLLPLLVIIVPTVSSYWNVYKYEALMFRTSKHKKNDDDDDDDGNENDKRLYNEKCKQWLMFWVVSSSCVFVYLVLKLLGLKEYFLFGCEFVSVLYIWLHLPFGGTSIIYDYVVPIVSTYVKEVKAPVNTEQRNLIIRGLVFARIISAERSKILVEIVNESGIVLLGLIFFFTPGFITYVGFLLVGCVFPIYTSAQSLTNGSQDSCMRWLKYWIIAVIYMCTMELPLFKGILLYIPLANHAQLGITMWLLLPYFRGAVVLWTKSVHILDYILKHLNNNSNNNNNEGDDGDDNDTVVSNDDNESELRQRRKKAD